MTDEEYRESGEYHGTRLVKPDGSRHFKKIVVFHATEDNGGVVEDILYYSEQGGTFDRIEGFGGDFYKIAVCACFVGRFITIVKKWMKGTIVCIDRPDYGLEIAKFLTKQS